jgi:hypothetical protein
MSAGHLVVLPPPTEPEPPADRIRRLQAEARALALQHIESLAAALGEASRIAAEIAEGGDLYPVGARELSRRLADDCGKHALTLAAIADRG